ncbi:HNH endonuclease [Candidatus Pacearchaeota archaeon]|nr:HNH endonuclease [Candidatus Pacearchaeota archaeon]
MEMKLKTGEVVFIDKKDYAVISQYSWYRHPVGSHHLLYAAAWVNNKNTLMHRFLLNLNKNEMTDHINGNGLDNRRSNLRKCTHQENMFNKKKYKNNKCGYKGVYWSPHHSKWRVTLYKYKKRFYIGYYRDLIEAAKAYNEAAIEHHGEFARLNKLPEEVTYR